MRYHHYGDLVKKDRFEFATLQKHPLRFFRLCILTAGIACSLPWQGSPEFEVLTSPKELAADLCLTLTVPNYTDCEVSRSPSVIWYSRFCGVVINHRYKTSLYYGIQCLLTTLFTPIEPAGTNPLHHNLFPFMVLCSEWLISTDLSHRNLGLLFRFQPITICAFRLNTHYSIHI